MKFCNRCRAMLPDSAVICPTCGANCDNSYNTIAANKTTSKKKNRKGKKKKSFRLGTIVVFIVFTMGALGVLTINLINSACDSYYGDFSQKNSYTVQYGEKALEIVPDMRVSDLNLSGLDVTYFYYDNASGKEIITSPDYEYAYDELYSTNCIQTEICRLTLPHSELTDTYWLELHFLPSELPKEAFPIKAKDCQFFFFTYDVRPKPEWFRFEDRKRYAESCPVRIEGIEPYMSIGEVKQLLGEPTSVSLSLSNLLHRVYLYENTAGQHITVVFSALGDRVLYVSGDNGYTVEGTDGDISVDYE